MNPQSSLNQQLLMEYNLKNQPNKNWSDQCSLWGQADQNLLMTVDDSIDRIYCMNINKQMYFMNQHKQEFSMKRLWKEIGTKKNESLKVDDRLTDYNLGEISFQKQLCGTEIQIGQSDVRQKNAATTSVPLLKEKDLFLEEADGFWATQPGYSEFQIQKAQNKKQAEQIASLQWIQEKQKYQKVLKHLLKTVESLRISLKELEKQNLIKLQKQKIVIENMLNTVNLINEKNLANNQIWIQDYRIKEKELTQKNNELEEKIEKIMISYQKAVEDRENSIKPIKEKSFIPKHKKNFSEMKVNTLEGEFRQTQNSELSEMPFNKVKTFRETYEKLKESIEKGKSKESLNKDSCDLKNQEFFERHSLKIPQLKVKMKTSESETHSSDLGQRKSAIKEANVKHEYLREKNESSGESYSLKLKEMENLGFKIKEIKKKIQKELQSFKKD